MAIHTNGSATRVLLSGQHQSTAVSGPGFKLTGNPDGFSISGSPAPEQVLRALASHGVLSSAHENHGRVDVTIKTTGGHDRYVYTRDLKHRLLFRRAWDRDGMNGVWFGLNPFLADTDGAVANVPPRPSLRNAVGAMATRGRLARVDVMNIFTLRTADAATLPANPNDRVADPELERQILDEADLVMLAWGSKLTARHDRAVRALLALLRSHGITPMLRTKHDQILTAGSPPQPTHPRMAGYKQVQLVEAPHAWLDGGQLAAPSAGVTARTATAAPLTATPTREKAPATRRASTMSEAAEVATGGWRNSRPVGLLQGLQDAGLSEDGAHATCKLIKGWADDGRFMEAVTAVKKLLGGHMPILVDGGNTERALCDVLPDLVRTTRDPFEIAQTLLVGAVCAGGVHEYASWLECSEPGVQARHKNREGLYPVPGIRNPGDARIAYARLVGSTIEGDATKARGHGSTLNAKGQPSPAERYSW